MNTNDNARKLLAAFTVGCMAAALVVAPFYRLAVKLGFLSATICFFVQGMYFSSGLPWRKRFPDSSLHFPFFLFMVAAAISGIFGLNSYESQKEIVERYIPYFLLFSMGVWLVYADERFPRMIIKALLAGGLLIGSGAIWQYAHAGMGPRDRLWLVFGCPIDISGWLTCLVPVALALGLFGRGRRERAVAWVAFAVLLFPLILHKGRSAWSAVFLAAVVLAYLKLKSLGILRRRRHVLWYAAAIVMAGWLAHPYFPAEYRQRIKTIKNVRDWSGRAFIWKEAVPMLKDHPILGIGPGVSGHVLGRYKGVVNVTLIRAYIAHFHNNYLTVLVETGLIGFLIFVFLFWRYIGLFAWRLSEEARQWPPAWVLAATASVLSMLIAAIAIDNITEGFEIAAPFWFLLGLSAAGLVWRPPRPDAKAQLALLKKTGKLSVVVLTKNEESCIGKCLDSVKDIADEMIVVDDHSRDSTIGICRGYGVKVIQRELAGRFDVQRNTGTNEAAGEWILQMDADEALSLEAAVKIIKTVNDPGPYSAFTLRRINLFFGKRLQHEASVHFQTKLFKKDSAYYVNRIHETLKVDGKTGVLDAEVYHYAWTNVSDVINKINHYTDLEALTFLENRNAVSLREIKYRLTIKALKLFFKLYVRNRGYKDGFHGLAWCLLHVMAPQVRWLKIWERAVATGKLAK